MSRHRINASLFFRIHSGVLLVSVLQALFTPCTDVFPRLEILGEGLPAHLSGMWLFLHRFHHELPEDDVDTRHGQQQWLYCIWGVVDMTEACPRISANKSLSKQSLYVGMPLWVPNSDFTLIYLTRTFQGLGLSPHISTLAYKVPNKETQHIQFPHT